MSEILCSTDYSQFKFHPQQRELRPGHVIKIQKRMKDMGFIPSSHIVVTPDFFILDGQHRFQAAKNLGIPIYYAIETKIGVDQIRDMAKTVENWNTEDVVSSWCKQGNDNYIRLRNLQRESGLAWQSFFRFRAILFDGRNRDDFYAGKCVLTEIAETDIREKIALLNVFKPLFKGWGARSFCTALTYILSTPGYSQKQMIERLQYQSTRLVRCPTAFHYVELLESIYNYRSHSNNVIRFNRPQMPS